MDFDYNFSTINKVKKKLTVTPITKKNNKSNQVKFWLKKSLQQYLKYVLILFNLKAFFIKSFCFMSN